MYHREWESSLPISDEGEKKEQTKKLFFFSLSSALVPSMTSEGYGKGRVVHVSCTHEDG